MDRYHRQMLLPGIGAAGQQGLAASHALVVGCGALGSFIIDFLGRAGVGTLTIVDRDIVELTNLQRQVLYDEADVHSGMPKAEAARLRLQRINSTIVVRAHVDDFNHRNAQRYAQGADIIMDGLDNFETRYLLNDLAVSRGLPYVYGGAVGTSGVSMTVLPVGASAVEGVSTGAKPQAAGAAGRSGTAGGRVTWREAQATPCLRCVFPEAPPPGISPTCDTAGVLGPVVAMIAAHQATQAIKLLTGNVAALDRSLLSIDLWSNEHRAFDVSQARTAECPCCGQRDFAFLRGASGSAAVSLCGRNAVQITPAVAPAAVAHGESSTIHLEHMAQRLAPHGRFTCTRFMLRGELTSERDDHGQPLELTLFPNGRAIIKGTHEPDVARTIYAKYIGA